VIEVSVRERIEAPAAAVWNLVGGFNQMRRWLPGVEHSTKSGEEVVGVERTLLISGGAQIVERLDTYDDEGRSYSYSFVDGPLPVTRCATTLRVDPDGEHACILSWTSRIEPEENRPPEDVAQLYEALYRAGIGNVRRLMARTYGGAGAASEATEP